MNRSNLQQLATDYLSEAEVLLAAEKWAGAYYLAGYAVEVALKSCVLARIEQHGRIFDDEKFLKDLAGCWTHDLMKLVKLAGLTEELNRLLREKDDFIGFWAVATDWDESSRYKRKGRIEAESLHLAITHESRGVLAWIKSYW